MRFTHMWSWLGGGRSRLGSGRTLTSKLNKFRPELFTLEDRTVMNGYLAIGAGPGSAPQVAIRVDIQDTLGGSPPNNAGQPPTPRSDGKTDLTTQIFNAYNPSFRGGVRVATGNLDGDFTTPDQLITGPGPGGGPHIIIWDMVQVPDGKIVVQGIRQEFSAYDPRFRGGVNLTTGDLDGDGRAELIVAPDAGGGPHVKIYKTQANGRVAMVNEFMAYDPNFRGGVSIAANQGYETATQVRQVLSAQLPDDFFLAPAAFQAGVTIPNQAGAPVDVPAMGFDFEILPGGSAFFDTPNDFTVPAGNPGTLDSNDDPLPYITVGAGYLKYLSGDLLNSLNQIYFRPNLFIPPNAPNPDNIGTLVFVNYADTTPMSNYPAGSGIPTTVPVGPFVLTDVIGPDDTPVVSPLLPGPAFSKRNVPGQLITGAGPGGGPHVKVWGFTGTAGGGLTNNGAQKDFMAFAPSDRKGVNVAFGSVVMSPLPLTPTETFPGVLDYLPSLPPGTALLRPETSANTAPANTVLANAPKFPTDPNNLRFYSSQIIVGQAGGGKEVRVFSDHNPLTFDPSNFGFPSPDLRTSISEVNLVGTFVDSLTVADPTVPLDGFNSLGVTTFFQRGTDPQFNGGVRVFTSAFNFEGSANTKRIGTHPPPQTPGPGFEINPALGQGGFANASRGSGVAARDARVRLFNQMSPLTAETTTQGSDNANYLPYDDFSPFLSGITNGVSVSFGHGRLNPPGVDLIVLPPIAVQTVTNPIMDLTP